MWDFWRVILLAAVQGVAEFLPVSSSGHLQVLGHWLGFDAEANLTLNVVLHAGTLVAILIYYLQKILSLVLEALFRKDWHVILLVLIGSVPTGLIGVAIKKSGLDELLFGSIWIPVVGFAVTATVLGRVFRREQRCGGRNTGMPLADCGFGAAFWIGVAQGLAIMPGISRSGSTIAAGVKLGLKKEDAAEFSFLLAVPAIAGAMLLECLKMFQGDAPAADGVSSGVLAAGFLVAAAVGYLALRGLIALLRRGRLIYFSYYLYTIAVVVAAVQLIWG